MTLLQEDTIKFNERKVSNFLDAYFEKHSPLALLGSTYENLNSKEKEENCKSLKTCSTWRIVHREGLESEYLDYIYDTLVETRQAIESAIFTGKNIHDGSDIKEFKDIALCKNGFVIPAGDDLLSDFYYATCHTKEDVQVLLSKQGKKRLHNNNRYNDDNEKLFSIEDFIAAQSDVLGYNKYHVNIEDRIENGVQMIVGDFSKICLTIEKVEFKMYNCGIVDGVNLLDKDKVFIRTDVFWKVDIDGEIADNFLVVTENPKV